MTGAELRVLATYVERASSGPGLGTAECVALARALHAAADDVEHLESITHVVPRPSNVVAFPRHFRCVTPGPEGAA